MLTFNSKLVLGLVSLFWEICLIEGIGRTHSPAFLGSYFHVQ